VGRLVAVPDEGDPLPLLQRAKSLAAMPLKWTKDVAVVCRDAAMPFLVAEPANGSVASKAQQVAGA
jgi:hypothetical protein